VDDDRGGQSRARGALDEGGELVQTGRRRGGVGLVGLAQDVEDPAQLARCRPARASTPPASPGGWRAFAAARTVIPSARVVDYATARDPAFVTRDGRSTYALVFTPQDNPMAPGNLDARIQQAVRAAVPASWHVSLTGTQALATSQPSGKGAGVLAEAMLGGLGALVVLAFVFASFLAVVPLVMAGISILTTFLALNGLTHITTVSQIVEFLIALIGLGVAIDYTLLVVTRWSEERAHGLHGDDAVQSAMASAGRAVLFSGLTVGIGLLALVVLPVPFLRSAGIGGVLIPLISVAVVLTLLPVLLGSVGPRLDWPRLRNENTAGRGWSAWARLVTRHRGLAALAGTATLAVLIIPAFSMHIGEPSAAALAQTGPAHRTLATLQAGGIPSGTLTPIDVLTRAGAAPAVAHSLASVPGIYAATAPVTADFRRAGTALVTVLPGAETNVTAGQATVGAVRAALAHDPAVLGIAGSGSCSGCRWTTRSSSWPACGRPTTPPATLASPSLRAWDAPAGWSPAPR
jgi:RND superfamily putative drug exporter